MVNEQQLKRWLHQVRNGTRSVDDTLRQLRHLPVDDLTFAKLDTHRRLRRGSPEAIFCEGKTAAQIIRLSQRLIAMRELVLLTRLDADTAARVQADVPALRYDPVARLGYWHPPGRISRKGLVLVATGGTADLPVAEEAALTAELLGSRVLRLYDVGVAGLHRVLSAFDQLQRARAIIVVAGMEGALASVVAGLARAPVVAVPTSIGYGASFGGIAPLLTMLNSCAPGVAVVNIDNGFGAGYLAHGINTPTPKR